MVGVPRSLFFLLASIVCFLIALLMAVGIVYGDAQDAWTLGGLLSLAISMLP